MVTYFDVNLLLKCYNFPVVPVNSICPDCSLTCEHCDLQEVEKLSSMFLDKLSTASALKHPWKNSDVKTIQLKDKFVHAMGLQSDAGGYSFDIINNRVDAFVNQSKNAWSTASSMMGKENPQDILRRRTAELAQNYFSPDESSELARLVIRRFDNANLFHCDQVNCGKSCLFAVTTCSNEGCSMQYSIKWADLHDVQCPHKLLECERSCGVDVKRMRMEEHLVHHCNLRVVQCPMFEFGCHTGKLVV